MTQVQNASERQAMALWCFPIITDLIRDRYVAALGGIGLSVFNVAYSHSHLWRARILDETASMRREREKLGGSVSELGLPPHLVEDIDEEILDELMDVVTQRFHRSPQQASVCGQILLHVAKNLSYTPEALTAA